MTIDNKIAQLDLTEMMARIRRKDGWKQKRADAAEAGYREFLQKFLAEPGTVHRPPSEDVDHVWHTHLLFTEKYTRDCQEIFGRFIHHHPDPESKPGQKRDIGDSSTSSPSDGGGGFWAWLWCSGAEATPTTTAHGAADSNHGGHHGGDHGGGHHGGDHGGGHDAGGHSGGHSCGGHGCGGGGGGGCGGGGGGCGGD